MEKTGVSAIACQCSTVICLGRIYPQLESGFLKETRFLGRVIS
jgi:hypothetical protein